MELTINLPIGVHDKGHKLSRSLSITYDVLIFIILQHIDIQNDMFNEQSVIVAEDKYNRMMREETYELIESEYFRLYDLIYKSQAKQYYRKTGHKDHE